MELIQFLQDISNIHRHDHGEGSLVGRALTGCEPTTPSMRKFLIAQAHTDCVVSFICSVLSYVKSC